MVAVMIVIMIIVMIIIVMIFIVEGITSFFIFALAKIEQFF
jgi:hypothetical protein